ncbi:MAG: hypothetical protein RLY20_2797 [Verrucomicrobiota bacterium]
MNRLRLVLCALLLALRVDAADNAASLVYAPDGDGIVITNGTRWNNRPLYCHERFSLVSSGEMPSLQGEMGVMYFGFQRGGQRVLLQHFSHRVMRYRGGAMQWEFSDARFPGLKIVVTGTTLADANGVTARMETQGAQPGDSAVWIFYPPDADRGAAGQAKPAATGFEFVRTPDAPLTQVHGIISSAVAKWEQLAYVDREDLNRVVLFTNDLKPGAGLVAYVPLANQPQFATLATADNDAPRFGRMVLRHEPLDLKKIADSAKAFAAGLARVNDFASRLKVSTPDPYLNAGAPMAVAAAAGIFVNPTFVHGGSHWRQQQPGWRTMGGAIYFGWPDQIQRAVEFWGNLQVKEDDGQHQHAEYSPNGCQQAGKSRFFGKGFIDYKQPPHYEFQTQFFDDAIRAWRASADPKLERALRPMLELHLERAKVCYDPDGDGLYESYNNTWPNDSIWFNGGGTPEQSGYIYYGHLAAADMARRAGDLAAAACHETTAAKIKKAVNDLLWIPERGQYASYVEPWGHQRQMPDAWVYAQHVPIESRLASPEQAWKAMFYTEWAMERFILPYGGEMRQTSNFLPGQWSIRELYHGDNFGMALGYFLGGQGDEGWNLLRGAMVESMYGDGVPKSGYSNESGGYNNVNRISPGGLSHPNCAVDFADIVSAYSRALIEGLFGYRPDYPNGLVRIEPTFPASWDHASIQTRDFALDFKGTTYKLALTKPAKVNFGVPVRARKVKGVTVDGKPVKFSIEPWAGYGMLRVQLPETKQAVLVVDVESEAAQLPVQTRQETAGRPGHRLEIKPVAGDVPRFQLTKIHVPELASPKLLREAPANATWKTVDLSSVHNGDIREIFKQRYESPRPDRVSMRIGYDGWSAWTFVHWGIKTPEISLNDMPGEDLVTPQRAKFVKPRPGKNIAFTSLWDNWPKSVTVPVNAKGDSIWLLVSGSTTPMQGKIANAILRFRYADGQEETLDLVPPENFWSLCGFGRVDYNYKRDGFSLPKTPPAQVQLGTNCRAMVYGWKLRPNVELKQVTLETLSLDVVIGLMGVSVMNPN